MPIRVLVVDGDIAYRDALLAHLRTIHDVQGRGAIADEAMAAARAGEVDVVFLEAAGRPGEGLELLQRLKRTRHELEVVVVTATARMDEAVKAMKAGAGDYLTKPIKPEQVAVAIDRARRVVMLQEENRRLREQLERREEGHGLVGTTPGIRRLGELIDRARGSQSGALIVGEPGTERSAAARALHAASPRSSGPFVEVDAAREDASIDLLGSAAPPLAGAVERAGGGTLHVVDAHLLVLPTQDVLARLARERVVSSPSAGRDVAADVRLVVSTSANLLEAVGRGTFRRELLDAVSSIALALPPLRERLDDLPLHVDAILKRRSAAGRRSARGITPEALSTLLAHEWPGNVAELERAVERACELGDGEFVERRHLPPSVLQSAEARKRSGSAEIGTQSLKQMESEVITRLLADHGGDTDAVSRILKIDRSTLYRKIKRYGIDLRDLKG